MRISTIADLAAAVRGRRTELGWSQGDLAKRAAVSRQWVNEFEAGKGTAAIATVLRVLDALGLDLRTDESAVNDPTNGDAVDLDALLEGYRRG